METSSYGRHRARVSERVADTPPLDPADIAGASVEEIVGDVWVQVLIGRRDQKQADMRSAFVRCDAARWCLAAALLVSDPRAIAGAQADLEEALSAESAASRAFDQARQGLSLELTLLTWRAMEQRIVARTPGSGQSERHADVPSAGQRLGSGASAKSALVRLPREAMAWFHTIAVSHAAGGKSS
jgi:hypothetical protein